MKKLIAMYVSVITLCVSGESYAQNKSTETWSEFYSDSDAVYYYEKSSLKLDDSQVMLNQALRVNVRINYKNKQFEKWLDKNNYYNSEKVRILIGCINNFVILNKTKHFNVGGRTVDVTEFKWSYGKKEDYLWAKEFINRYSSLCKTPIKEEKLIYKVAKENRWELFYTDDQANHYFATNDITKDSTQIISGESIVVSTKIEYKRPLGKEEAISKVKESSNVTLASPVIEAQERAIISCELKKNEDFDKLILSRQDIKFLDKKRLPTLYMGMDSNELSYSISNKKDMIKYKKILKMYESLCVNK